MLINMGENCQLNCVFCRRREFYDPSERTSRQEILGKISETDDGLITFSGGGEPTMSPRLPRYMGFAKKLDKDIMLETNGLALYDPAYFDKLLENGLKHVILNVLSHDEEIYEEITQTPGSFPYLVKALENLSEHPGTVKLVSLPLTELNYTFDHFKGYFAFLNEYLSDYGLIFHCYRPNYTDGLTEKYLPDYDDLGNELARIHAFCEEQGVRVELASTRVPPCKLPGKEGYAMVFRDFETYYDFRKHLTYLPGCDGCAIKDKCLGVPKNYLKLREFTPEPFDKNPISPEEIESRKERA